MRGIFQDSAIPAPSSKGPRWTLAHGFFVQMGGFQNIIDAPRITEEEIQDRGKGDIISKIFIIVQTTWFVVQCLARWSQHLPVSELEVVTLGFAMLNGVTYALWWHKPQNVGRPVLIERKNPQGISSETPFIPLNSTNNYNPATSENFAGSQAVDTEKPTRPNPGGELDNGNLITIPLIGALFGSVHLIPSWFLDFASHQEMWLWRASAMVITAFPLVTGVGFYMNEHDFMGITNFIVSLAIVIGIPLYVAARIILLVLSLTSLRSLSGEALQTIEWTTFIPHL
ncbi:hypothetical protein BDN70DRAFT_908808 [Pholiota conissans]|uniref:Uncharacterized protein n=1 Tax=Pholiota conissans TaxID=109636 RepID=A0A9P5YTR7_9AGAR|nr:hypothetical protein BDN70DRAFT_908808 [Pholiota conissans]